MDNQWLKDAIVEYFKRRPSARPNSLDIVSYFKLRVDITYTALVEMENEGTLKRTNTVLGGWNGNHYYELA